VGCGFLWSFYHVAGVQLAKNLQANAGRLVLVPEEMSQTLLTNHGGMEKFTRYTPLALLSQHNFALTAKRWTFK
jgi:hypothetical protein